MLDELFDRKRNLEESIENFFGDDENPHYGDRGYQDLLEQLDDVQESIDEEIDD